MAFTTVPASAFTDDVSTITAATLNTWRTRWANVADFGAGGTYSPTAAIIVNGSTGINMGSPLIVLSTGEFEVEAGATCEIAAECTQSGMLVKSGTGGRTKWRYNALADADASIDVDDGDYHSITVGTTTRTITILQPSGTGIAEQGEMMHIVRTNASTGGVQIKRESSGANLITLTSGGGACTLVTDGVNWRVLSAVGNFTLGADAF